MIEQTQSRGWWPSVYEPLRQVSSRIADWFAPASEASSKDKSYEITIELPGVDVDDVEISVNDGVLTLKGEKRSAREEKGDTYYFSERQYGAFSRSFRLPADADASAIKADMKDGVLTVSIAKKEEKEAASSKIEINRS